MSVTYKIINDVFRGKVYGEHDIFTAQSFRDCVRRHDLDLSRAICAYDEGKVVGALVFAQRGERAWMSLIGVLPDYRKTGLGRVMLVEAIDALEGTGVRSMEFEAIVRNEAIHAMYAGFGFNEIDRLCVWARPARRRARNDLVFKKHTLSAVEAIARKPATCWQREALGVSRAATLALIECEGAYAFVRLRADNAILLDAGARDDRAAAELVRELDRRVPYDLTLLNEPESSPLSAALGRARWRLIDRQRRMIRTR